MQTSFSSDTAQTVIPDGTDEHSALRELGWEWSASTSRPAGVLEWRASELGKRCRERHRSHGGSETGVWGLGARVHV